ncbi:MAG: type II toxin-antitoxin system RelE/ParE family toxin [Rhodopseudomonas sp.]|uniref:type II toxin-antitoxin system RelE/ParE family toxin n=1 Tax=Rhodopseudomonas sp. TaxID=1078 RepID=UPI0017B6263B|nr:type II toxin-antitoxin system RelE/ParE family toxin [Rhodopseudomonas sp.]NVN85202.1 type II toxin-antitoxin system RelE/ParE family toxin [Rhodopseudomonas sp.]
MKFVLSSRAEADLLAIHAYFSERNPAAADRTITRFFQRFDELCEFPFLGPDRSELRASLRGILVDGYVVFYMIEPNQIVIVRVLDGRMNIEGQFAE